MTGWPDKPGVPLNPEQEQWGWLATPTHGPVLCRWADYGQGFRWFYAGNTGVPISDAAIVGCQWSYLGQCPTPAEVAAREQAAAVAVQKQAAEVALQATRSAQAHGLVAGSVIIDAIKHLTVPTDALDAALREAREQGYRDGWNDRESDLLAGADRVLGAAAGKEGQA